MIYAPDYYPHFRCIADACRHSCCVGWEIDIDPDTRAAYAAVGGDIGAKLADEIDDSTDPAHFRLTADERCPFLRNDGLCELILTLGEDSLCQICADHPRFRNFFSGRTELGLGLCCEAAGALILSQPAPMQIIPAHTGWRHFAASRRTAGCHSRPRRHFSAPAQHGRVAGELSCAGTP